MRSPLQHQAKARSNDLAYPSDSVIPGARDVPTQYGSIRVYEFGPAEAEHKVLFLHGISTPCISLIGIAENLAFKKGCRVMLMDLFGRGWSDGPRDLPHDGRLYASQIFMALASSTIAWTGPASGGFTLIGYSLGGGLAADFTSWFPELVSDLVLLAPAGLIREANIDWKSRILYSQGWLPECWVQAVVKQRLRVAPNVSAKQRASPYDSSSMQRVQGIHAAGQDAEAAPSAELPANAVVATTRGEIDIGSAVNYQMDWHEGFLPAFMSSIRNAPIRNQHERWRLIGERISKRRDAINKLKGGQPSEKKEEALAIRQGLKSNRVLIIFGGKDTIIKASEVGLDAKAALSPENIVEKIYEDAGHEVPISHCDDIADDIWRLWEGDASYNDTPTSPTRQTTSNRDAKH